MHEVLQKHRPWVSNDGARDDVGEINVKVKLVPEIMLMLRIDANGCRADQCQS